MNRWLAKEISARNGANVESVAADAADFVKGKEIKSLTVTVQTLPVIAARMPGSRCHGW
jgi:hypothetical protein